MRAACPISNETLDERAARLCALLVLFPLGMALYFASPWPALMLVGDFGLRGFGGRRASPFARLARAVVVLLGLSPRPINAAPKVFAARLGFAFATLLGLSYLAGADTLGVLVGVPFALCASLEAVFGFCVGCRLYRLWQRVLLPNDSTDANTASGLS
jgi:hypothetical protein